MWHSPEVPPGPSGMHKEDMRHGEHHLGTTCE